jgi:hypothetical protein
LPLSVEAAGVEDDEVSEDEDFDSVAVDEPSVLFFVEDDDSPFFA